MPEKKQEAFEKLALNNLAILAQKLQRADFDLDEWKLIEGVDLGRIDLAVPENRYQLEIIEGLLGKNDHGSVFSHVVRQLTAHRSHLEKVQFMKMQIDDLGNKIGTKREVDLVKLILHDGQELNFTTSIDIRSQELEDDAGASPSACEAKNLALLNGKSVQSVQQLYASRTLEIEDDFSEDPKTKTFICKEYLEGDMLEFYLTDLEYTVAQIGEEHFKEIAFKTGYALQEPVSKSGYVIKDSNPLNFIVGIQDGISFVRYCDADTISSEAREIALEMRLLRSRFGKYAVDFDRGAQAATML